MIDYFSLALSHGLLLLCLFRIARNKMLDPAVPMPKRRQNTAKTNGSVSSGKPLDGQAAADDPA